MKLMIVESPNKVAAISKYLGPGWVVKASVGHIRDLPAKEIGIGPDYRLQYEYTERGADVVKRLKGDVAQASEIYLATDPDREGEAIAWHLKETLRLPAYHRVTFDAITKEAILAAIGKTRKINTPLVRAQEARRALDRLVGYRVSPALSDQTGLRLSAGRVQSPAVRLVVDREREIAAFRETRHFGASVTFDGGAWHAEWNTKPFREDGSEYLMDGDLAARAAACRNFTVTQSTTKPERRAPPPPFITSTLLQAASVAFKMTPDQAMQAAQGLFESGHITYHRTDSENLSADAIQQIRDLAQAKDWGLPSTPRKWKSKDGAQEAHEAIRPTHWEDESAGDNEGQRGLYRLIWQRAVACQLADAEYITTALDLESQADGTVFQFRAKGSVPVALGWKVLTAKDAADDDDEHAKDDTDSGQVPGLAVGTAKTADSGKVLDKKTRPPTRYTQASLIKKLEALGIGRPSTFAAIMKHVMGREYLREEKLYLKPTATGCEVVDGLCDRFSFIEYGFTKEVEEWLDDIASDDADYIGVVRRIDRTLNEELGRLSALPPKHPCPECGRSLRRMEGKRGPFWSCSGFPDGCAVICEDDDQGKPGVVVKREAGPSAPSEKQLEYAQKLSAEFDAPIPSEALTDAKALAGWIDTIQQRRAASPASEAQMKWVRQLVDDGASAPTGWPDNVTGAVAKAFLDQEIKKTRKKSGGSKRK